MPKIPKPRSGSAWQHRRSTSRSPNEHPLQSRPLATAEAFLSLTRCESLIEMVLRAGVPEFRQIEYLRRPGKRQTSHLFPGVSSGIFLAKRAVGLGARGAATVVRDALVYRAAGDQKSDDRRINRENRTVKPVPLRSTWESSIHHPPRADPQVKQGRSRERCLSAPHQAPHRPRPCGRPSSRSRRASIRSP